ncbi:MAG: glutathione S-transferase family protein [Inquilinus sp.]|nr:glutathione S-transferase family protein [Inquilinus sp.]
MLRLYQFANAWGLQPSPFCLKLATWLRMAGVPYEPVTTMALGRAPKGKLPYVVTDAGETIADSGLIIEHLTASGAAAVDDGLSPVERATALAFTRLLEDHLYFIGVWFRWVDEDGWAASRPAFFGRLKAPLRLLVPPLLRRGTTRQLRSQGTGRFTADQLIALARADFGALAAQLGDRPFLLGDTPRTVDASAYGVLANILFPPVDTRLQRCLADYPTLAAYCQRLRALYWAD